MCIYHKLQKTFASSLGHTLNFCPNLVQYRFKNMYLKESLTRSSMLIYFISSRSKIVHRDHREDYVQVLCLVLLKPWTDHSLSVALWLPRRSGIYDSLVLTSSEATGSWSPFPLIVSRNSFSHWTCARVQSARSTVYFNGCPQIFWYTILLLCLCTILILPRSPLWLAVGHQSL